MDINRIPHGRGGVSAADAAAVPAQFIRDFDSPSCGSAVHPIGCCIHPPRLLHCVCPGFLPDWRDKMTNRSAHELRAPVLVPRAARLAVCAGVLAAMAGLATLAVASSHDAVERKLGEFDASALLAGNAGAASGQARVAAPLVDRYHAALPEDDGLGCDRPGRRPG